MSRRVPSAWRGTGMGELRSMTGLGLASGELGGRTLEISLQGVNHRHADLVLRLPEELRALEPELRRRVAERTHRGRSELSLRWERAGAPVPRRRIDREGLARFLDESRDLVASGAVRGGLSLGDLARSPFVVPEAEDATPDDRERESLLALVDRAIEEYDASRQREGAVLARALEEGLADLRGRVEAIAALRGDVLAEAERRLRERLAAVLPGGVDSLPPERLAQEVVLLVDRLDVREEVERLGGHLDEVDRVLAAPGPHGRRLDFLLQEILRELNTIGSKSRDLAVTSSVVEAKVVHERLREQAQNVE